MAERGASSHKAIFAVLVISTGALSLLQSLVSPVLPLLQDELKTDQNTVTWVLTAYLLSASVCAPILGRVGDMIGKERVLAWVLIALAVGTVMAALSTSITLMIVSRVIQGIGGGVIPLSFGIVRDQFPRERVAGTVSIIAALLAVGGGAGLVLAGPIVNVLDYHWLFWIPAIFVVVAAVATYFFVPRSIGGVTGRVSFSAALALSGWLMALLIAISQAPAWGWLSGRVIGLLAAAVTLAAAWVVIESRATHPLIDLRMMRLRPVWTTNLVALLLGGAMYAVFVFVPEFLQSDKSSGYGFGASITFSGVLVLPMSVCTFIFGAASAPLAARYGARVVMAIGCTMSVIPFIVLATMPDRVMFVVAIAWLGIGFGLVYGAMASIIVDSVPSHQTGVANGMNANIRTIGGSIGTAAMGSIVTSSLLPTGLPTARSYSVGFSMLGGILAVAAVTTLFIPRLTGLRDQHQQEQAGMSHPELAIIAAGTLVGDDPE